MGREADHWGAEGPPLALRRGSLGREAALFGAEGPPFAPVEAILGRKAVLFAAEGCEKGRYLIQYMLY